MTHDTVVQIDRAKVQYGPLNDRIYVMKWDGADPAVVLPALSALAGQEKLGKIVAKVPVKVKPAFLSAGYREEAAIPGFYHGDEDAVFLCRYENETRGVPENAAVLDGILRLARRKAEEDAAPALAEETMPTGGFSFRYVREEEADEAAQVYRQVFKSYPFPIHDPAYIRTTVQENVLYFSIRHGGRIVALASAEMDHASGNAEMTDFATLPDWRGHGLASVLLGKMEHAMGKIGIKTLYTIARAASEGINIVFARHGYAYGGRLVNNTNIAGQIESMNIWHKRLA